MATGGKMKLTRKNTDIHVDISTETTTHNVFSLVRSCFSMFQKLIFVCVCARVLLCVKMFCFCVHSNDRSNMSVDIHGGHRCVRQIFMRIGCRDIKSHSQWQSIYVIYHDSHISKLNGKYLKFMFLFLRNNDVKSNS